MPGIRPAVLLHSLPFSFRNNSLSPRTLPLMVMKSKIGSECLLWSSSKKLPDNCNHGWWCGFSVSLATDILFTKCPPGSEAAGLSAGANGPIPQAKCYSRRWWKNCVGLLLLSDVRSKICLFNSCHWKPCVLLIGLVIGDTSLKYDSLCILIEFMVNILW